VPLEVTPKSPLGIKLKVDKPSEVGADRLLNALAAHRMFNSPAIVIDFGTATTFDCISAKGDYLGGAILLGPALAAESLSLHTAKLPKVSVRPTKRVVGKNTIECIQAGLYYGYAGMIKNVLDLSLKEMCRDSRKRRRIKVITTGGLAGLFNEELERVDLNVPDLTLNGLQAAYELIC
jgi:type III pantothenate kinase